MKPREDPDGGRAPGDEWTARPGATGHTSHPIVAGARRIAVLRANALGDLTFALPALEAIRAAYPAAEIVLLGRAWHRELFASRPAPVDRVVVLPHPFIGDEAGDPPDEQVRRAVLEGLSRDAWDVAIQMHGGGRNSNPLVRALGARVTAGARTADAAPLDRWIPYRYWQHEVHRNLEIAGLVGAAPVSIAPRLAATARDRVAARDLLERSRRDEAPIAVLHPGATDPRRRWPAASFAAVGCALVAAGCRVAVTGAAEERVVVDAVVDAMDGHADRLAGRSTLTQLTGLLAESRVVVANDTGPLHLAAALGTPTVGIFWCGNVINAAPPFRAAHAPLISWRLACPTCGVDCTRATCAHRDSFVADVSVDEVIEAALAFVRGADSGAAA